MKENPGENVYGEGQEGKDRGQGDAVANRRQINYTKANKISETSKVTITVSK